METPRANTIILFGVGVGAVIEIIAHQSVSGQTDLWAILLGGTLLAAFVASINHFWRQPLGHQVTILMAIGTLSFIGWSTWLNSPFLVTADLRVTGTAGPRNSPSYAMWHSLD